LHAEILFTYVHLLKTTEDSISFVFPIKLHMLCSSFHLLRKADDYLFPNGRCAYNGLNPFAVHTDFPHLISLKCVGRRIISY